jgi:hypothetical protein
VRVGAVVVALASMLGAGCSGASAPAARPPAQEARTEAAASPLDALEQRLVAARTFRIRTRIASGGRIQSHFDGSVVAGPERRMRLAMQGALGGKDVDALFLCDGGKMGGGASGKRFEMDAAPALREGIAVAFVRMGLLHDVARLSSGLPPDFLDGAARRHLGIVGLTQRPGEDVRGAATDELVWGLEVDGKRSADETLWLDHRTGLPLRRRVVVHFPEGDMEVGEEYDEVAVDEPEDDATFRIVP